jgi:putative two-component system response regulator
MNDMVPKKILIVDDDPSDILLLKKILEPDYSVIEITNASRVLDVAISEQPDLVITDVMMPGISGYTLCNVLKSNTNTKEIPVIMVTGLDAKMNKEIGGIMGADGYLAKPVKPKQLSNMVSRLLKTNNKS